MQMKVTDLIIRIIFATLTLQRKNRLPLFINHYYFLISFSLFTNVYDGTRNQNQNIRATIPERRRIEQIEL